MEVMGSVWSKCAPRRQYPMLPTARAEADMTDTVIATARVKCRRSRIATMYLGRH